MTGRASAWIAFLAAAALAIPLGGCSADFAHLQATVSAQSQLLAQLQLTPTASPTPSATPPPAPSPSPTPTSLPTPLPSPSPTFTSTPTLADMLEVTVPSVFRVRSGQSAGTGFALWQSEIVLTALHVVASDPAHLTLLTRDGVQYKATVLASDERRDLALLSVGGLKAPPLKLGRVPGVADPVIVVGYSASLPGGPTVARGIVSALRLEPTTGVALVQTDAAMNPGSSGGPLLNERGEVIGLVDFGIRGSSAQYEALGFAVSPSELSGFFADVQAGRVTPIALSTRTPTPTRSSR